ncbi:MAG TPA: GNAT family N-acetyltransferase [Clostridia bacterium]|nr:GNAT family N-acetyltransferase [Clostridia bacterium]
MKIVDLKETHLEEAYKLFASSYECQRKLTPILDESNGRADKIMSMLKECIGKYPGIAVVDNGRLTGYMSGMFFQGLLGVHKGAFVPEWAHASVKDGAFDIYRRLYQAIGQSWVAQGCLTHAIQFLSCADAAQDAFCWNGFGRTCIDAIRRVEPIYAKAADGIRIVRITEKDLLMWLPQVDELCRHIAKSPIFNPYLESETPEELDSMLKQPGNFAWMAWYGNEAVGYMKIAPITEGAAWVVNGKRKVAVNGAYVKPEYRGRGIAKMLLSTIMESIQEEGFERCSVDFEATNLEAYQFWPKYFQPVCKSMARRLDERILKSI